jgi:hypothetical protein
MDPDRFFTNPPWAGGRGPFRLGLAPIARSSWLAEAIAPEEQARKRDLLRHQRDAVLARVSGWDAIVDAAAVAVAQRLSERGIERAAGQGADGAPHAPAPPDEPDPLARAALGVPEDLCVMARAPAGWTLVGACLCSPSFWRLGEKIGRPLDAVHAPVSGLVDALGVQIAQFLDRLPVGRVFERRNWNLHHEAERFHPHPETAPAPTAPEDCAMLHVRSERQTLAKLDADSILFTIDVGQFPLGSIVRHPAAMADLRRAVIAMTPDERQSFRYARYGELLLRWLDAQLERVLSVR